MSLLVDGYWIGIRDGDPRALALYLRHYSCHKYRDNRRAPGAYRQVRKIMGPGEYMLLLTEASDALFGWLHPMVETLDKQEGVRCSVFRNEGPVLSSDLIREADDLAWERWPGQRLYTYIDAGKVRSTNPGTCFLKAGWRKCGITKINKLLILERLPSDHSGRALLARLGESVSVEVPGMREALAAVGGADWTHKQARAGTYTGEHGNQNR